MFVFNNTTQKDISAYIYELYEEDQIVNPNAGIYELIENAEPVSSGQNNASVFAINVNGSYVDENGVEQKKHYYGRVRLLNTSGVYGSWTPVTRTDIETELIDEQYIVSLTADRIKAGEIESAAIILGGANPINTIIKSKTYDTSSGAQGWYIRGDGHFSLGGPNGITYNNATITIGSAVQVTANLSADSITVGTSPNLLQINDAINSGNGGMTLGDPTYNYWYANGNFRMGGSTNYVQWNGSTLSVVGQITATTGSIGGWSINSTFIRSSNNLVTLNSNGLFEIGTASNNKATITSDGDFTVYGTDGVTNGVTRMYGGFFNVKTGSDPAADAANTQITFQNIGFFKPGNPNYGVFISGGNNGNNAFIDVGATGISDNGSVSCNGWFRSSGTTGWYNQTYGGGIYMADSTWVRTYGSKNFYVDAKIRVDGGGNIQNDGLDAGGIYIQQGIGIDSNQVEASGALYLNALGGGVRVNGLGTTGYGLTVNGNAAKSSGGTAWATFSDLNLKKDITEYEKGLNEILQLRPVYFKYNGKAGTILNEDNVGLIAQEVQAIFPKTVEEFEYCPDTKPNQDSITEKYLSFSFNEVQYALINAIKQLSAKIDELESRLV